MWQPAERERGEKGEKGKKGSKNPQGSKTKKADIDVEKALQPCSWQRQYAGGSEKPLITGRVEGLKLIREKIANIAGERMKILFE